MAYEHIYSIYYITLLLICTYLYNDFFEKIDTFFWFFK